MSLRPNRSFLPFDTTGDSGARTAAFTGGIQVSPQWARGAIITLVASAASGSNTMQLQYSPDNGVTWINYGAASTALTGVGTSVLAFYPTNWSASAGASPANFAISSTVAAVVANAPIPPMWRLSFAVPTSITITGVFVNYIA